MDWKTETMEELVSTTGIRLKSLLISDEEFSDTAILLLLVHGHLKWLSPVDVSSEKFGFTSPSFKDPVPRLVTLLFLDIGLNLLGLMYLKLSELFKTSSSMSSTETSFYHILLTKYYCYQIIPVPGSELQQSCSEELFVTRRLRRGPSMTKVLTMTLFLQYFTVFTSLSVPGSVT